MSVFNAIHPKAAGLLCAAGLLFLSPAVHAADPSTAFQVVFAPATQTVSVGAPATFTGSITNISGDALYITGDALDPLAPGLTVDDSPFFNTFLSGAPVQLGAGQTYTFTDLFTVTDSGAAFSSSVGRFTVYGGTTLDAQDFSGSKTFTVQAVPEASTLVSLGLMLTMGAGGMVLAARKKKAVLAA